MSQNQCDSILSTYIGKIDIFRGKSDNNRIVNVSVFECTLLIVFRFSGKETDSEVESERGNRGEGRPERIAVPSLRVSVLRFSKQDKRQTAVYGLTGALYGIGEN